MTVEVFAADEQSDEPVDAVRWIDLARAVLKAEGVRGDTELSLLFVDEPAMAELNLRFLDKEGPTDVLAFPIDEEEAMEAGPAGPRSPDSLGPGPTDEPSMSDVPRLLGDIVVCPAVARTNAPGHAGTYDDEMALLIVHGVLHLLGMDHEDAQEAARMEQREQEMLDRFHRKTVTHQ
ncbi:MAG: putative rRNA maturation factor [Actinomycetota bacterium]|nr:putative rRNA maturation factor [Actinomycetota bacterium]